MPGTYHIKYTDPNRLGDKEIVVEPLTAYPPTDTAFPLKITGYRYPQWGTALWTDLLHLLENFASKTDPAVGDPADLANTKFGAIPGQIWVDTNTGFGVPKFRGTDNVWHEIGSSITIGENAPLSTGGLWFSPTTRALSYWNGTVWENILCTIYAAQFEYNDILQLISEIYTLLEDPRASTALSLRLTGTTQPTTTQWLAVIGTIRDFAAATGVSATNIVDTGFTVYSDSTKGLRYFQNAYDALIIALLQVKLNSTPVIANCMELALPANGPAGATKVRTLPWDDITHIATIAFNSTAEADRFFTLGGEIIWNGSIAGATPNTNSADWAASLQDSQHANRMLTPALYQSLSTSSASPTVLHNSVVTSPAIYSPSGNILITGYKVNGVVTITVRLTDPDANSVTGTLTSAFTIRKMRTGPGCAINPVVAPAITSQGTM